MLTCHGKISAEFDSVLEKQILLGKDQNLLFFSRYLEQKREFSSSYLYTDYCFGENKGGDIFVLLEHHCRNIHVKPGRTGGEQAWFILEMLF